MQKQENLKMKKIMGAILSSLIFSIFFLFVIGLLIFCQMNEVDRMPWPLFFFSLSFFVIPLIGIIYNLISRIKEILGGEEDEASQY